MSPFRMPPTPVLQTPRLVLRPLRAKDAPVIQKRFANWEVVRWLDAKVPWPYPTDGAAAFVVTALAEMAGGEKSHWAIIPKKGPADLIGVISLRPDDGITHDQGGFWLDSAFQGRGLMSEAADRVTEYAFGKLDWPCLWLSNAQDNRASRRLKEKQGARLVDMMIGQFVGGAATRMVWQLTREDWLTRQPVPPRREAKATEPVHA